MQKVSKKATNQLIHEANEILSDILRLIKTNQLESHKELVLKDTGLMKIINKAYTEYLFETKKKSFSSTPLFVYFYKFLNVKFASKKRAQTNYHRVRSANQILYSIARLNSVSCFNLFGKFMGMSGNLNHNCFEIFIFIIDRYNTVA